MLQELNTYVKHEVGTIHDLYTCATHINPDLMKTELPILENIFLTIQLLGNKYKFYTPTVNELNLASGSRISYLPYVWFFFSSSKCVRTTPICKKKEKIVIKLELQNDVSIQLPQPYNQPIKAHIPIKIVNQVIFEN